MAAVCSFMFVNVELCLWNLQLADLGVRLRLFVFVCCFLAWQVNSGPVLFFHCMSRPAVYVALLAFYRGEVELVLPQTNCSLTGSSLIFVLDLALCVCFNVRVGNSEWSVPSTALLRHDKCVTHTYTLRSGGGVLEGAQGGVNISYRQHSSLLLLYSTLSAVHAGVCSSPLYLSVPLPVFPNSWVSSQGWP